MQMPTNLNKAYAASPEMLQRYLEEEREYLFKQLRVCDGSHQSLSEIRGAAVVLYRMQERLNGELRKEEKK